jgi:hypothetical protein
MSFSRPIQWYHSHVDPIWPDGTFKVKSNYNSKTKIKIAHFLYQQRSNLILSLFQIEKCLVYCWFYHQALNPRASACLHGYLNFSTNGKRKIAIVSEEDKASLKVASIYTSRHFTISQRKTQKRHKTWNEKLLVFSPCGWQRVIQINNWYL